MALLPRFKFPIDISECVVLVKGILECPEVENDANFTINELIYHFERNDGYISKPVLESALYCSNMLHEDKKFWHHKGWTFPQFLEELLPPNCEFDLYYNVIKEKEKKR